MEHPVIIDSRGKTQVSPFLNARGLISQYLASSAGRSRLAQSMIQPLRTRLDYQGLARKVFQIEPLPEGALPTYDCDPNVSDLVCSEREEKKSYAHDAVVINSRGQTSRKEIFSFPGLRKVIFPTFEIVSNPTIRIDDVKRRRFNLIDRAARFTKQQILAAEDQKIFDTLDTISTTSSALNTPPGDKDGSKHN